jgi:uracil-DNA glycosylase
MTQQNETNELVASLRAYLEELQATGVDGLPIADAVRPPVIMPMTNKGSKPSVSGESAAAVTENSVGSSHASVGSKVETLDDIRLELGECSRCTLGKTRNSLVFGVGNPHARIVFVGEAPGRDEDLQGEPFVGEAGQLLTKIIEAMQFSRSEVYICNLLKCRPTGNRNPHNDEIEQCQPFLLRQLKAIGPEVVVCLGTFASQTLLQSTEPISALRGHFHDYHGIPLMPTFHPAFLLRNAGKKRYVWEDMQQVMKLLGKEILKK